MQCKKLFNPHTLIAFTLLMAMAPMAATAHHQEPVNLRSTDHFVVLAGSLISNIPGSMITGDVGLSPATGSNVTGFGDKEITGTMYVVDASGPAGSVASASDLTTAKGDLTKAYNDAAGRTPVPVGPFLDTGAGNIGGLTLGPGLYKFTSSVSITGSDLTLSGPDTAVWIFQIASELIVGNGIKVTLAGGAKAANIFWQVGSSATLGTTSAFKGTIMADQSISMNTGASLEGRALASIGAVTLASNAIVKPTQGTTAVKAALAKTIVYSLKKNTQTVEFMVPIPGRTTLKILNASGREIGRQSQAYP